MQTGHLNAFLFTFLIFFTTGCIEYTTQICTTSKLRNIPEIEGERKLVLFDSESFETVEVPMTVKRMGKGQYGDGKGIQFRTCFFGNKIIAESETKYGTYRASVMSKLRAKGVVRSDLVIGKTVLENNLVPYQIVEREIEETTLVGKALKILGNDKAPTYKILVVDNSSIAAMSVFTKYSEALGSGFAIK